jgi:hypothetical protein
MSAVKPVDINIGERAVKEDLSEAVAFLNSSANPVIRKIRERLNDFIAQVVIGEGAPATTTAGCVYVDSTVGAASVLYVKESGTWVAK